MVHIIREEYMKRKGREDATENSAVGSADVSRFGERFKFSFSFIDVSDSNSGES